MKSKGGGTLSIHFCEDEPIIETIFRAVVSANQLSIYGAVADLCEEFGNSLFCAEKSFSSEKQTESMVKSADLLNIQRLLPTNEQAQGDLLSYHKERVQNLSKEKQLIKMCTDAGFIKTVAPGQFFLTKDAEAFSEFDGHVGCGEYSIPRDGESSTPKGWIRENTEVGPVLEVTTHYHQGKPRIEVRIVSPSGDGSHSCVRISNGLNKFVRYLAEKTRIHGDDENNSASTGRPVVQESRLKQTNRQQS